MGLSQGNEVATVRVLSTKPRRCVVGYVAREANNAFRECVTYRRRSQVAADILLSIEIPMVDHMDLILASKVSCGGKPSQVTMPGRHLE